MAFYDKMTHRVKHTFFVINGLVIFGGALIILYLAFIDGAHPVTIENPQSIQTVQHNFDSEGNYVPKDTFYTGEQLTYAIEYCKNRAVPATIYGAYIDTVKIYMPELRLNAPVGCGKTINDNFKIPKILPSGIYHFEVDVIYQVNPIRKVKVHYRTEDFNIINNDIKGNL